MYGIPEMSMLDERTHAKIGSFAEDYINDHGQIERPDFDPWGDDMDSEDFERMGYSDSEDSTQPNIPPQMPPLNPLPPPQPFLATPNLPQPSQSMVAQEAHVHAGLDGTSGAKFQGTSNGGLIGGKGREKMVKAQKGGPVAMAYSPSEQVTASADASVDLAFISSSPIPSSSFPVYYADTSADNASQDANKASSREQTRRRG